MSSGDAQGRFLFWVSLCHAKRVRDKRIQDSITTIYSFLMAFAASRPYFRPPAPNTYTSRCAPKRFSVGFSCHQMLGAPSNALKVGSRSIQSPANDNDRFLSYSETECDGARSRPRHSVPPTLRRFRELRRFRGGLSSFLVCSGAFPHLGTRYRLVSPHPSPSQRWQ